MWTSRMAASWTISGGDDYQKTWSGDKGPIPTYANYRSKTENIQLVYSLKSDLLCKTCNVDQICVQVEIIVYHQRLTRLPKPKDVSKSHSVAIVESWRRFLSYRQTEARRRAAGHKKQGN